MTKKFWADWQKRAGETKTIWRWCSTTEHYHWYDTYHMNNYETPHRFIHFDFSKDAVNITYEVLNWVIDHNGGHQHSEIHKIRLHRNDIKTVKFRKPWEEKF